MKILITGGSGLVGKELTKILIRKGYDVAWLSRRIPANTDIPVYLCNYKSGNIDKRAVQTADIIIHLAGANIGASRWSAKRQGVILNSRVKTAQLIFDSLNGSSHQLKAFISASAIGYYGAVSTSETYTETSNAGNDFLANVCRQWESVADNFSSLGVRVAKIRTGVVISQSGGALEKISSSFKFGAKVVLGSGKQYIPWIHIYDLCNIYAKAVEDENFKGPYNAVTPEHQTYDEFSTQLKYYFKRVWINVRVPAFFLRLILGKMAVLILEGSKIDATKIINSNFQFKYPTLKQALGACYTKKINKLQI